jgi:hypothetical protein
MSDTNGVRGVHETRRITKRSLVPEDFPFKVYRRSWTPATIEACWELLIVIARAQALALRGHRELVFENVALRQRLQR